MLFLLLLGNLYPYPKPATSTISQLGNCAVDLNIPHNWKKESVDENQRKRKNENLTPIPKF